MQFDGESGFVDSASASAINKAAVKAAQDALNNEVKRSAVESRVGNTSSAGMATGSTEALLGDDTVTLPDVLPVLTAPWPEAVAKEWSTFKAFSSVGIFSSICRAYVIVDNRLLVWNFFTGKEFLCYDELQELLVVVSEPVKPKPNVFQAHITRIIVCSTPKTISLIGLSIIGEDPRKSEIRMFNLGYQMTTPCVMVKFAVHERTGRVFAAGADGNTYELEYTKENSIYQSRMKLVNHSVAFGKVPILSTVGHAWKQLKQTWSHAQPTLRDICLDQNRSYMYTLAADSTITVWKVVDQGGLIQLAVAKHNVLTISKTLHSNVPSQLSPLVSLFPVNSDRGYHLVSIAENGDVYRYICADSGWSSSCYLDVRERCCYPFTGQNREVNVAWCSNNIFACAPSPRDAVGGGDSIAFVTTPPVVMRPFQHVRDVVSTFDQSSTGIIRVDAIGEASNPLLEASMSRYPESVSQVFCPPRQFVVAHRHGVSVFVKLRPVDTLHTILLNGDAARREELLRRFQDAYSQADLCCMLLQLATGDVNVSQTIEGQSALQSKANPSTNPAQRLGMQLLQPVTHEVQRLSRDLLMRSFSIPTWSEVTRSGSSYRDVAVTMSPFVSSISCFVARALVPVWDQILWNCSPQQLRISQTLLGEVRRQLDQMKGELWPDASNPSNVQVKWEADKVILRVPPQTVLHIAPQDVRWLQTCLVTSLVSLIELASQVIKFLQLLQGCGVATEEVRFSELICVPEKVQALARSIGRQIVTDPAKKRDLGRKFLDMQSVCPRLFADVDVTEYQVRLELDRIHTTQDGTNMKLWTPERIRDFEITVAANAGVLWTNGSLAVICQELRSMQREDTAVRLLLQAAAQLDATNVAMGVHQGLSSTSPSDLAIHGEKIKILQCVVALLEGAWESNKKAAESLLGTPGNSGTIWTIAPSDSLAHCFLFEWYLSPRSNAAVQQHMEETALWCRSQFFESFLERAAASGDGSVMGRHYARYLRIIKRDYRSAVFVLTTLAQSTLSDVPPPERLRLRHESWREALECATEGRLTMEATEIDRRLKLTQAQSQLVDMVKQCCDMEGEATSRSLKSTLELLECLQGDEQELMRIADELVAYGGGDVQLLVLSVFPNVNPSYFASAVENCFRKLGCDVGSTCQHILQRYGRIPGFPLSVVIKYLERHSFDRCGGQGGNNYAVDVICESNVELHSIFAHYVDILEHRDQSWKTLNPLDSVVPDTFLCYSMALVVKKMVQSPQMRQNAMLTSPIIQSASETLARVSRKVSHDMTQRRTLEAAERIIEQCQTAVRSDASRLRL